MKRERIIELLVLTLLAIVLTGCGEKKEFADKTVNKVQLEPTTIYVDAAASLKTSIEEIIKLFNETQPNIIISLNTGSSGTLIKQIEESNGIDHDIFFSADVNQVKMLDKEDHLMIENSRVDLLTNQLCLVKAKETQTKVTGWENISQASNLALCDGTVPVGKYSRNALVTLGFLSELGENSQYTTIDCSEALGGMEINECSDANAAAQAVAEGSNEIGMIYYSDYYDFIDDLDIIAIDDGTLTGKIVYTVCQVVDTNASELQNKAARYFITFLQTEEALKVFENHGLIVN